VNRLIDERVDQGELNDSNLTFKDLKTIKDVFLQVLQGVHHPRISYPEPIRQLEKSAKPAPDAPASPQPQPSAPPIRREVAPSSNGSELTTPGGIEESINLLSIKPLDPTMRLQ
jgi:hypothetical protein